MNKNNYHSKTNFMSVSTFKGYVGTLSFPGCEAKQQAIINKDYRIKANDAMLIGAYIDEYFTGDLESFKANTPAIFKKDGTLYSKFVKADEIINSIERDNFFMNYLQGEKQQIFTGEIFGVQWKGMIDILQDNAIIDLKIVKSIRDKVWSKEHGKISFIEAYGYDIQLAIYQKLVEINTGKKLDCYIAAASKESPPDKAIIQVKQNELDYALSQIEQILPGIMPIFDGLQAPERCECCEYCRLTNELNKVINITDL